MQEQIPDHPVLSKLPTMLSIGRFVLAPVQAWRLATTDPEDRTLVDASLSLALAITDGLDGILARRYGSTPKGAEWDKAADRTLFMLSGIALAAKGEVLAINPVVDFVREGAVYAMRQSAVKNNRPPIDVGWRGKLKTATKFTAGIIANSPAAKNNTLLQSTMSLGSAFSILSAVKYAGDYFEGKNGKVKKVHEDADHTKNGVTRQASNSVYDKAAKLIVEKYPWATADRLTFIGGALVIGSNLVTLAYPELGFLLAAIPYTGGSLFDGVDGKVSELRNTNSVKGMIKDATVDKIEEITTAAVNSLIASRRKFKAAAFNYAVAAATAPLTAYARAVAESRGYTVSEDAVGSRVTRGIEGGVGLGFNKFEQISTLNGALMAASNIVTFIERVDVIRYGSNSQYYRKQAKPHIIERAKIRVNALKPMLAISAITGAALVGNQIRKK